MAQRDDADLLAVGGHAEALSHRIRHLVDAPDHGRRGKRLEVAETDTEESDRLGTGLPPPLIALLTKV